MGTRRSLAVALSLAAVLCAVSAVGSARHRRRDAASAGRSSQLPNRPDSFKFAVLGDFGTGSRQQFELGARDGESARALSLRDRHHRWRQHLRRRAPAGHVAEVRAAVQGAARRRREVLRLARQPRRPRAVQVRPVQHGGPDVLHLQGAAAGRAILRPRDRLSEGTAAWRGSSRSSRARASAGRSRTSTIRSTRRASGTDRTPTWPRCSNRLFQKAGVSAVFAGHDHFYERTKPQKGIVYFVIGSGGQLRKGGIDRGTGLTAVGFDTDLAFLAAEIDGDELYFNAISRAGTIIDSGVILRRKQE